MAGFKRGALSAAGCLLGLLMGCALHAVPARAQASPAGGKPLIIGFVFDKMVQDGVIHVEVLSELDSEEAQRAADEVVKDFQDTVMRELFRPMVALGGFILWLELPEDIDALADALAEVLRALPVAPAMRERA